MVLPSFLQQAQQWLLKTPERALDQAYEAARMIAAIENEHFGGNPISPTSSNFGQSAQRYFQGELKKYLNLIDIRMTEFRASSSILRASDPRILEIQVDTPTDDRYTLNLIDKPALFFRKLRFVDEVLARYRSPAPTPATVVMVKEPTTALQNTNSTLAANLTNGTPNPRERRGALVNGDNGAQSGIRADALSDRANVLPRSILRTVDRIRQDLDPQAEEQVMRNFRASRGKTTTAVKFILLLLIIPLLTQQFTKNFIIGPMVDYVRGETEAAVFLNLEMEEEALHELQQFEERLRFEVLIGKVEPMPELAIEQTVREKATDIEEEYRSRSADAVKNVFSDILAAIAFAGLLVARKREVAALKGFMDEVVYGLSDSAKAFIIILFTDVFVGFHSPHGWEILLEGLSRHLGFAANRDFIFLFIATFPVILDTVFKYWIFRYLNRISPSAVATYKNMNE
ncbi:proton extrusion protein PcxA [Leptolyngbya sp. PCC 6406]|uniref:proton extrusion protein PcxA n=1 Tax=Leptolyngbya sp. PCC 6406 TaxID=1173264 RepID=UPI0002AB9E4C|nr:proton extrusion protein PcxA [Leptolyngbya sp. PCC 6406]